MADIFNEVAEDLRRERMKALWDRYGGLVLALAAVLVLAVAGWRGYLYYQNNAAAAAGDRYQEAVRLSEEGKSDEARKAFADIAADAPKGYPQVARLREADEIAKTDPAAAMKLYQDVASGEGDGMLRDAARIRAAFLAVDHGSLEDVRRFADPLATAASWSALAREAIGLAAYKAGDAVEARRQFEAIVADAGAPGSTRQRADLLLAVLGPAPEAASKPTN